MTAEVESWIGTPWIHGQCLKGVGVDCVRFVSAIGRASGWVPADYHVPVYNQDWALHNTYSMLEAEIQKFLIRTTSNDFRVGDILLFVYGKCASHAGIYIGDDMMVHSYIRKGVIKSSLKHYRKFFHSAWRQEAGEAS